MIKIYTVLWWVLNNVELKSYFGTSTKPHGTSTKWQSTQVLKVDPFASLRTLSKFSLKIKKLL